MDNGFQKTNMKRKTIAELKPGDTVYRTDGMGSARPVKVIVSEETTFVENGKIGGVNHRIVLESGTDKTFVKDNKYIRAAEKPYGANHSTSFAVNNDNERVYTSYEEAVDAINETYAKLLTPLHEQAAEIQKKIDEITRKREDALRFSYR